MAEVNLPSWSEISQAFDGLQLNSTAATWENILARLARIESRLLEHERKAASTLPPLRPEPDPPDGPLLYAAAQPQFQIPYYKPPPLPNTLPQSNPSSWWYPSHQREQHGYHHYYNKYPSLPLSQCQSCTNTIPRRHRRRMICTTTISRWESYILRCTMETKIRAIPTIITWMSTRPTPIFGSRKTTRPVRYLNLTTNRRIHHQGNPPVARLLQLMSVNRQNFVHHILGSICHRTTSSTPARHMQPRQLPRQRQLKVVPAKNIPLMCSNRCSVLQVPTARNSRRWPSLLSRYHHHRRCLPPLQQRCCWLLPRRHHQLLSSCHVAPIRFKPYQSFPQLLPHLRFTNVTV